MSFAQEQIYAHADVVAELVLIVQIDSEVLFDVLFPADHEIQHGGHLICDKPALLIGLPAGIVLLHVNIAERLLREVPFEVNMRGDRLGEFGVVDQAFCDHVMQLLQKLLRRDVGCDERGDLRLIEEAQINRFIAFGRNSSVTRLRSHRRIIYAI